MSTVEVIAYLDPDQDLYHTSYVYTGLLELARQGRIALDLKLPAAGDWRRSSRGDVCVNITLRLHGELERNAVFDLKDRSDRFCGLALERCDLYFKRSYFTPDLIGVSQFGRKVIPFGMNYSCSTVSALPHVLWAGWRQWSLRGLPDLGLALYRYYRRRRPEEFLWGPDQPKKPVVLFQTQLWEAAEVIGDDAEAINLGRVAIVGTLKAALGNRFVGGLIPNRLARDRYPHLLTTAPHDPRSYTRLNRNSLIGVYTRGLHHSTAWKLGEYFAASMCVVAEPIRNQFPHAIENGKHFLGFEGAEACLAACHRILDEPGLQRELRLAGYDYFQAHIAPAAHLAECIETLRNHAS